MNLCVCYMAFPTCVSPACDVAVGNALWHFLPPHWQAGGQHEAAQCDAAARDTPVSSVARHTHQCQVVVIAVSAVARVKDDLIHCILFLILLRNQRVIITHTNFIQPSAVTVSRKEHITDP